MKHENRMDETIRLLKKHYYGNISLLVVAFAIVLFKVVPLFTDRQVIDTTVERYAIMITLMAIPASLKFFAHRLKKSPRSMPPQTAAKKYKKAYFLRLYTISGVALMHVILFGISRNMNFFWLSVVSFIVFLFCKPSHEEPESLSYIEEEQQRPSISSEEQDPSGEKEK